MKFERKTRHVMYDGTCGTYRVTWDPVYSDRRAKDPKRHLVGVSAAVDFWDLADVRTHCMACARAVGEAWSAGDRYLLDTDEARQAAELVADLSACQSPDEDDLCAALLDLQNAIARVRLQSLRMEDFEGVLETCRRAIEKCIGTEGYSAWSAKSRKRRFMYALRQSERTPVVLTLMGLYYGVGPTPILTRKQRIQLERSQTDGEESVDGAVEYFDECLRAITAYRFA